MIVSRNDNIELDLIGETVAGIICDRVYLLNDILVVQDMHGRSKVLILSSLANEIEMFTIEGLDVLDVLITAEKEMFLFKTNKKMFLVNKENHIVEDSDLWKDFYFDVLASSFYRMDLQGYWYDIEGFRMKENVFLKGDVLISLATKRSKKSLSFEKQEIYISENKQLIQIGKVVLNLDLDVVKYFGEKVTEIGQSNISFEAMDVLQEVKVGIEDSVFINEYTHEPFLYNDSRITSHLGTYQYGNQRVVLFEAEFNAYGVVGRSDNFMIYNHKPLQVSIDSHLSFNGAELIKVNDGLSDFYFDINRNQPFYLPDLNFRNISYIDKEFVKLGDTKVFNVSNNTNDFVVKESDGSIFTLDEGSVTPQRIDDFEFLSDYFGIATIDGQRKMFSKKFSRIFKFGNDSLEVSQFTYKTTNRLVNAVDTNGSKLVLDFRHGYENVSIAESNGEKISAVYGDPVAIGNRVLLNVSVAQLGGSVKRVIDMNEMSLPYFTLPAELKESNDHDVPSVFAGSVICEIRFLDVVIMENKSFMNAVFASFSGVKYPVILECDTANPLHLQGVGHRNELASSWMNDAIDDPIYLGRNRMICVNTIRENLKTSNLLFSIQQMSSWLPFYNGYLPIFKRVIELNDLVNESWAYYLFELAEVSKAKEYIVVEKNVPNRIMAFKKSGEYMPRILKSRTKPVKSPEGLNVLERFFYLDSSILVEVE